VYRIEVRNTAQWFDCKPENSLLSGIERHRVEAIRVGCRGGGCGVCRIKIVSGEFESKKMSIKHVTHEEAAAGYALSCRVFPRSDMAIEAEDV